MRERITALRKELGLKQIDFAKRLGVTQASLSMIEMGHNAITEKNIKLICMTFNVNEHWLRTGEGEMFNSSPYAQEIADIMERLTSETQEYLVLMGRELLLMQEKMLDRLWQSGPEVSTYHPDSGGDRREGETQSPRPSGTPLREGG